MITRKSFLSCNYTYDLIRQYDLATEHIIIYVSVYDIIITNYKIFILYQFIHQYKYKLLSYYIYLIIFLKFYKNIKLNSFYKI